MPLVRFGTLRGSGRQTVRTPLTPVGALGSFVRVPEDHSLFWSPDPLRVGEMGGGSAATATAPAWAATGTATPTRWGGGTPRCPATRGTPRSRVEGNGDGVHTRVADLVRDHDTGFQQAGVPPQARVVIADQTVPREGREGLVMRLVGRARARARGGPRLTAPPRLGGRGGQQEDQAAEAEGKEAESGVVHRLVPWRWRRAPGSTR